MKVNNLPIRIHLPEHFLDEEVRDSHLVSSTMKAVWAVQIDLLFQFMRICDKYGLNWMASGGTALGAVRHGGYIPWDDDVDIEMPREDYDKFCRVAPGELEAPYFFSDGRNERQIYRGHAQLRNSLTTAILKHHLGKGFSFNQGIFIDIFPQDGLPADISARKEYLSQLERQFYKTQNSVSKAGFYRARVGLGTVSYFRHLAGHLASVLLSPFRVRKMERMWLKYSGAPDCAILGLIPFDINTVYPSEICYPVRMMTFEWFTIPVPRDFEEYLSRCFGQWKTPVKGMSIHGEVFFDPLHPYTDY